MIEQQDFFWPRLLVPSIAPPSFATPLFTCQHTNSLWLQTSIDGKSIYEFAEVEIDRQEYQTAQRLGSYERSVSVGMPLVYGYIFAVNRWSFGTYADLSRSLRQRYGTLMRRSAAQALIAEFLGDADLGSRAIRGVEVVSSRPYRGQPQGLAPDPLWQSENLWERISRPTERGDSLESWVREKVRDHVDQAYIGGSSIRDRSFALREFQREEAKNYVVHQLTEIAVRAVIEAVVACLLDPRPQVYHNIPHGQRMLRVSIPNWLQQHFMRIVEQTYSSDTNSYDLIGFGSSGDSPPLRRLHRQKVRGMLNAAQHAIASVGIRP